MKQLKYLNLLFFIKVSLFVLNFIYLTSLVFDSFIYTNVLIGFTFIFLYMRFLREILESKIKHKSLLRLLCLLCFSCIAFVLYYTEIYLLFNFLVYHTPFIYRGIEYIPTTEFIENIEVIGVFFINRAIYIICWLMVWKYTYTKLFSYYASGYIFASLLVCVIALIAHRQNAFLTLIILTLSVIMFLIKNISYDKKFLDKTILSNIVKLILPTIVASVIMGLLLIPAASVYSMLYNNFFSTLSFGVSSLPDSSIKIQLLEVIDEVDDLNEVGKEAISPYADTDSEASSNNGDEESSTFDEENSSLGGDGATEGSSDSSQSSGIGDETGSSITPSDAENSSGGSDCAGGDDSSSGDDSGAGDSESSSVSPGLGDASLTNKDMVLDSENTPVLEIVSDKSFSYLKAYSGYDYDPSTSSFAILNNSSMDSFIASINVQGGFEYSFMHLFDLTGPSNYDLTITNVGAAKMVYVPYGPLYFFDSVTMYQDNFYEFNNAFAYNEYSMIFNPNKNISSVASLANLLPLYTEQVYAEYLSVPDSMLSELQQFLLNNNIDYTSSDKASLITQVINLLSTYEYTLTPGENPNEDQDLISYFLYENKKGYCIHFAGSTTLLLRTCGIPARYVSGYKVTGFNNNRATVTSNNAHAWCEIYQSDYGWSVVEATSSTNADFSSNMQENSSEEETQQDSSFEEQNFEDYEDENPFEEEGENTEEENEHEDESGQSGLQDESESDTGDGEGFGAESSSSDSSDLDFEEIDSNTKLELEEDSEDEEDKEEEKEESFAFSDMPQLNTSLIIAVILFISLIIAVVARYLYLKRYKHVSTLNALEIEIYKLYDLLSKFNFTDEKVNEIMYRIRYSLHDATDEDLTYLITRKEQLIQEIKSNKKLYARVKIKIVDKLDVL